MPPTKGYWELIFHGLEPETNAQRVSTCMSSIKWSFFSHHTVPEGLVEKCVLLRTLCSLTAITMQQQLHSEVPLLKA